MKTVSPTSSQKKLRIHSEIAIIYSESPNPLLAPQEGDESSVKLVETPLGVRLLNLNNVCYDLFEKRTYLYTSDEKGVQTKTTTECSDVCHFPCRLPQEVVEL